jgi:hypothetical protein
MIQETGLSPGMASDGPQLSGDWRAWRERVGAGKDFSVASILRYRL